MEKPSQECPICKQKLLREGASEPQLHMNPDLFVCQGSYPSLRQMPRRGS